MKHSAASMGKFCPLVQACGEKHINFESFGLYHLMRIDVLRKKTLLLTQ